MERATFDFRKHARLEELAAQAGVFMDRSPALPDVQTIPPFTEDDRAIAETLLLQKRKEAFSSKSHVFRRTPSQRNFTRDEIYTAMESVVRSNSYSPGVLQCLLDQRREAKAKKHIFQKDDSNDRPGINCLLRMATEKGDSKMVLLLGQDADVIGLDSSLKLAVMSDNVDCIAALLQSGADAKACSEEFIAAVETGNRRLVSVFLGASNPLDDSSLNRSLAVAVRRGRIQLVISLLQHGANGDDTDVVEPAVRNGQIDIAAALALADRPPSSARFDQAFPIAYQLGGSRERQLILMELLLCAGANGVCVASTLAAAVKKNDERLVSLIVTYNGSVTHNSCESLKTALGDGNLRLLETLFRGHIAAEDASCVLSRLPNNAAKFSVPDLFRIVSSLVKCGACGPALDKCLIYAAENGDLRLVEFLVARNASVNHEKAAALLHAMLSGSMPIFKALLKGRPSQKSFEYCLLSLSEARASMQLYIVDGLLSAGAKGEEVDSVLIQAVSGYFTTERESFIETLVKHGADVNTDNGICFQKAATAGDIVVLNLLLKGRPSPACLSTAIPPAFSLHSKELRYTVLDLLLSSGARGPAVDQLFLALVDKSPADPSFVELFLDKGKVDVNLNNGKPLQQACEHEDSDLVELLLRYEPSTNTLNAAFPRAIALREPGIQYQLCRQLLVAGVQGDALDNGLVDVQRSSSSHPHLLELLLEHGANVSFRNGTVIRKAIERHSAQQLDLLVSRNPSLQVLTGALELLVTIDTSKKTQMAKILLDADKDGMRETVNRILLTVVGMNKTEIDLLELLLHYGASVDHNQGLAIRKAIENRNSDVVDVLLPKAAAAKTLEEAFKSAWALDKHDRKQHAAKVLLAGYRGLRIDDALLEAVQEKPYDLPTIELLLEHDASVHHQMHKPLVYAAISMDIHLLELLMRSVTERSGVLYTFGEVIAPNKTNWLSDTGFAIMELLLQNGVSGDIVGIALILAVEDQNSIPILADFVDLFLRSGASVDYQNGRALRSAVKRNQLTLVKKILGHRPSSNSMTTAFSTFINSDLTEDATLKLIEAFKNSPAEMPDLDNLWDFKNKKQEEPLTFTCLKKWPRGTKVLEQVLQAGVHVDKTTPYVIESEQGLEHVSVLLWALLQPQQRISPYVIECLLTYGADANFQSTGSLMTPILVATMERPPEIVLKLIEHGADVSVNDKNNKSPLFHASRRGQVAIMNSMINKGAIVDDGSLHEASRLMHPEAIQLLISHGHNPNFPSMLHDGRCPLAELCLNATGVGISRAKIRQTINALVAGKADLTVEAQGKPLLLHALDNPNACITITTELLASGMWKLINSECNAYNKDGFVYSPTTYITKFLVKSSREHSPELLRILRANGCKDIYYKQSGVQPPDMVGAPADILEEERRRKSRLRRLEEEEEEHQITLKRGRDVATQQQDILISTHRLQLQHDKESADQREVTMERSGRLQLRLDGDAAAQRQRNLDHERAGELSQLREKNKLRIESDRQHNQLQLEHEHSSANIQKGVVDNKLAAEMKRLQETEAMYNRQYGRESDLASRQERLMENRKELMNSGKEPNLLEYNGSQLD